MAEGGEYLPVNTGSDMVYDFYCELCIEDGIQVEAKGYCQDCGEYLCGSCYGGHRKSRLARHHVLLDKDSMPKDTPLAQDRVNKDISTKCKIHKGEPLKYYCTSHNDLGCASCFVTGHRGCTNIETIMEASENFLETIEYQTFISKVESIRKLSREIKARACDNQTVSQKCCENVFFVVEEHKEEAIRKICERMESIVTLAEQMKSEDEEKMASIIEQSDTMLVKIEQISSEFGNLQSARRVCDMFITMREKEADVTAMLYNLDQLEINNIVREFKFEPNVDTTSDVLGKLTRDVQPVDNKQDAVLLSSSNMMMSREEDINVEANDDATARSPFNCCITSSAVISNNRLVITDSNNEKVKLIDTSTNTLLDQLKLSCQPRDVAMINDQQAAVTVSRDNAILIVNVTDRLTMDRKISLEGECHGVASYMDMLFVTFVDSPHLKIFDTSGILIRTIEYTGDGDKLFQTPKYVCVSRDGSTIYVSDESSHAVTSLTMNGVVKAVYKNKGLRRPRTLCTDHRGNVYVCGNGSKNVYMLTADCMTVGAILTEKDGLDNCVNSVSHCQETDRLFIGMISNSIKVYKFIA